MKAMVFTEYGLPDVLELKEVEKPVSGDYHLLIRVHATTVNRTDCATIRAKLILRERVGIQLSNHHVRYVVNEIADDIRLLIFFECISLGENLA